MLGFRLEIFGGPSWLNFFFALSDCKDWLIFISGRAVPSTWHPSPRLGGTAAVTAMLEPLGVEWVGSGGPASVSHLLQLKPRP